MFIKKKHLQELDQVYDGIGTYNWVTHFNDSLLFKAGAPRMVPFQLGPAF